MKTNTTNRSISFLSKFKWMAPNFAREIIEEAIVTELRISGDCIKHGRVRMSPDNSP